MPRSKAKNIIKNRRISDDKFFESANKELGGYFLNLEDESSGSIERIPTGIPELDEITGGGYPRGRVIEVFGPEMSGKTWLFLKACAENQSIGNRCAFFDVEQAFNKDFAKANGVDTSTLLFTQDFEHAEDVLDKVEKLCLSGLVDLVGIDSTAGLISKMEMEAQMEEQRPAALARAMSSGLKKIVKAANQSGTAVVFINQLRDKVGVMFGNPESTPGGRALKFFSSIRIRASAKNYGQDKRPDFFDNDSRRIGHCLRCEIVKNKTYPPYKVTEVDLLYNPYPRIVQKIKDANTKDIVKNKKTADGRTLSRSFIYGDFEFNIDEKRNYYQVVDKLRENGFLCDVLSDLGENLDLYLKRGDLSEEEIENYKAKKTSDKTGKKESNAQEIKEKKTKKKS